MKRQIQRPVHETFNDGFLYYGFQSVQRSSEGKRIGETYQQKGKLAFRLMSARDQDFQLAGTMSSRLDLKVKTKLPPSAQESSTIPSSFFESYKNLRKSNIKIRIGTMEYDVITVDFDTSRRYLFFYLQEVGGFRDE
ncbi:hypothetical protein [Guptibacillus hwajinpoensis]|uniref:Phage head-tail adapter protein n=1 Tax=Guptibacillus hwajinpoensis TaxID=208199 RepID=A0A0J6CZW4_9BACL|nr:hypothetical protein [Alkalihalobacillus macyae]KMM38600.1 hypothetical protein AB986_04795 [Alkalihalobacillus macyae]